MNPVSPMTYEVIKWVLYLPTFHHGLYTKEKNNDIIKLLKETGGSQRKIAQYSGISKSHVNKTFLWLEKNNFIEKNKNYSIGRKGDSDNVKYHLIDPIGILKTISLFRSMKQNQIFEFNLDIEKKKIKTYLMKQKIIFCLDSALEKYDTYFRGDTICCYLDSKKQIKKIKTELPTIKNGLTKISFYSWDINGLDIKDKMNSTNGYTTELQTIIDLFCDNKAHYTKELLKRRWGITL